MNTYDINFECNPKTSLYEVEIRTNFFKVVCFSKH